MKKLFYKKNKTKFDELKNKIYIEELRPEMTQCRVIQVDKKMEVKKNDYI